MNKKVIPSQDTDDDTDYGDLPYPFGEIKM